jgi:hypothetical protein
MHVVATLVATVGLVGFTASPASSATVYSENFEDVESAWRFVGDGSGSGWWELDRCVEALSGCGFVTLRTRPGGWHSAWRYMHLSSLSPLGFCRIEFHAKVSSSMNAATARLEIIDEDTFNYIAIVDRRVTSHVAWSELSVTFTQGAARDVIIRLTIVGDSASSRQDIDVDDLDMHCRKFP